MSGAPAWTPDEVAMLRRGEKPPARTLKCCYTKAYKLGIGFSPKNRRCARRTTPEQRDAIAAELSRTGLVRETARRFGVSYSTVMAIGDERGIARNAPPARRMGESVVWGGRRWAWSNHQWRCTTGDRGSLARAIWEDANGRKVPEGMRVVFIDHDARNLDPSNLAIMDVVAQGRHTHGDGLAHAKCVMAAAIGHITRTIRDMQDPSRKSRRSRKAWETRRKNEGFFAAENDR